MNHLRRWFLLLLALLSPCVAATRALAEDAPAPVSFRLGSAEFTPGGYFEMTAVRRSSGIGSGLGTAFGAIPYSNTAAGNLSEVRLSAQQSRLSLRVTDAVGDTRVAAFGEVDWAGNSAASVWVNGNGQALRMRQFWASLAGARWEFLAGQAFSWVTPNRTGLSSEGADLLLTHNVDDAMNVGLPWSRGAQFRVAYHPNEDIGFGVALENPQQYVGTNGEVLLPAALNATLAGQFDAGNNAATPNYQPDLIAKAAWDGLSRGGPIHLEVVGLARTFRATSTQGATQAFEVNSTNGSGAGGAASIALGEKLRIVGSGLSGKGIGRYMGGLGPDVVVRPLGVNPNFDFDLSAVKSVSYLLGIESDPTSFDQLAVYFGRTDFDRDAFPDVTVPGLVKPVIGFGGANSPSSANRTVRELTFDASHAFWSSPEHGSLQVLGQYSRVARRPVDEAPGGQRHAIADMVYASVRYTLP